MRPFQSVMLVAALLVAGGVASAEAQESAAVVARVELSGLPDTMNVGQTVTVKGVAYDSSGHKVDVPVIYTTRGNIEVDRSTGVVKALRPGTFQVGGSVVGMYGRAGAPSTVVVREPPIKTVQVGNVPAKLYTGTAVRLSATITDAAGLDRSDQPVRWSTTRADVVELSRTGEVTALKAGTAVVRATAGGVTGTATITAVPSTARTIIVKLSADSVRTGDVVHVTASVLDAAGKAIKDFPVAYALRSAVEDTVIASEPPADIDQHGVFVADRAGEYTVLATAGDLVAKKTIFVTHRFTTMRLATAKGHGNVNGSRTSDLWVWGGKDGRDYAMTGTLMGSGLAYFWDVTDPANPIKTDSIKVDARTVNDVKVDVERQLCVITREGASNRKNGFVVLDCSDPRHVKTISTFDDGLYGGVHNVFVYNKYVFAINAGTRFDIISIEDPAHPKRVSYFELTTPGHGIHDVWVVDGIAYASQWKDGVILVDVGNGIAGGSPEHPVQVSSYKYPIGATHSAYPYKSPTGKFYVVVGDEQGPPRPPASAGAAPQGLSGGPGEMAGYVHIVDFTDLKHPAEVARYQIPEAGPHNFWIQNDSLYVAYYNAGLRVVDISGELRGNLYEQGRELVRFEASDPNGFVPNAPMAWGPQPYKGHVFFSDMNSGLWSVKLPPRDQRALVP